MKDTAMKETTLCYIEQNNQYLMLHRTKKLLDPNEGKWIGVGGKLEPGETKEQCLVREVKEETGLKLLDYEYRAKINFYSDIYEEEIMYLFTATSFTGDIIECDEGDLAWVDKEKVMNLNLWEGDKIFLQRLLQNDGEIFELSLYYEGDKLNKFI